MEVWCCCGCASLCKSVPPAAVGRDSEEEQVRWGMGRAAVQPVSGQGRRVAARWRKGWGPGMTSEAGTCRTPWWVCCGVAGKGAVRD